MRLPACELSRWKKRVLCPFTSGTYTTLTENVAAEPIPLGLARQLYEAMADPQYEGQISLAARECPAWALGCVLNVTGGRPEWATARALVQTAEYDIDSGTTTLNFGPANHIGVADIIDQLRAARLRRITVSYSARLTGSGSGSASLGLGDLTAASSAAPQLNGGTALFTVTDPVTGRSITLDPYNYELGRILIRQPNGSTIPIFTLFQAGAANVGDTIILRPEGS